MKKMLVSIILCMIMAFNLMGVSAYEYVPYVGDGVISATPVTVKFDKVSVNGGVEEVTEAVNIADATRVTASCMVKPGSSYDEEVKVMMIIAGYKGRRLVSYNSSETTTFSSATDSVKKVSAVLEKGEQDIDGVKVFLWDSVDNARPLFNHGNFGTAGNTIEGILIGGQLVEIDETTKTGSIEVNAGYVEWPDIVVLTDDITTEVSVDVKGSFPLSKPIHTIANANTTVNGTSETGTAVITVGADVYTVSVTQAIPQITNVKFKVFSTDMSAATEYYADTKLKIQYDVQNPVWTEEYPGPDVEDSTLRSQDYYKQINGLENVSWAWSDTLGNNNQNAMFFDNIVPELLGSQYFALPWFSGKNTTMADDCFKFTIDRSARIYMAYADGSKYLDSTWERVYTNMFASNDKSWGRMFYEMRINPTSTTHTYQVGYGNQVYVKDYIVEPGETCEISLPAGANVPRIFVKYADTEFVSNPSYTVNSKKTDAVTLYMAQPSYRDDSLTQNKYDLFVAPSSTTVPLFNGTGNVIYGTSTFYETDKREFALITVPDELVGATALRTPFTLSGTVKYDFDLSQSARVYVFTNAGNETGSTDIATLKASLGEGWYNTEFKNDVALAYRTDDNNLYEGIKNNSSFYQDYIVQPDDDGKVSITLEGITEDTRVIIAVKQLEE